MSRNCLGNEENSLCKECDDFQEYDPDDGRNENNCANWLAGGRKNCTKNIPVYIYTEGQGVIERERLLAND